MAATPNNQAILNLSVQQKGIFVMAEDDPNNRDPIARKKLEALYGEGNILVLSKQQFLAYQGGKDLVSIFSSEKYDPTRYQEDNEEEGFTGPVTFPPPTNLTVVAGSAKRQEDGTVTITVEFEGESSIAGQFVDYFADKIAPQKAPFNKVTGITAVGNYPIITIGFNTATDSSNYVIKLIDVATNTFLARAYTPAQGASKGTFSFTGVPRKRFNVSVTPYNDNGLAGPEDFAMNGSIKKVIDFVL